MENNNQEIVNQQALTAFITAIISFAFMASVILCVPGLVAGIISLAFSKKGESANGRPYHFFIRFSKPVSIVSIVLSAITILAISITLLVFAIMAIVKNVQ